MKILILSKDYGFDPEVGLDAVLNEIENTINLIDEIDNIEVMDVNFFFVKGGYIGLNHVVDGTVYYKILYKGKKSPAELVNFLEEHYPKALKTFNF